VKDRGASVNEGDHEGEETLRTETPSASPNSKRFDPLGRVLLVFGILTLGNALWMLAGPLHWYTDLPAAVPDTGPFNPHFVRDIGCAFLAVGVALVWAARNRSYRLPLVAIAAFFLAAHAVLHVYDTVRGALGHDHWLLDLPGVYLPGILLPLIALRLARESRNGRGHHGFDSVD
jgi:hypothetical protein